MRLPKPCSLVAVALIGALCLPGCTTDTAPSDGDLPLSDVTFRIMQYGASFIARNPCGGSTLIVRPGQTVIWVNRTGQDRKIVFDATDKLIFGVPSVEIPKGDSKKLTVLKDLDGHPTHQYRFSIGDTSVKSYLDAFNKETPTIQTAADDGSGAIIPDGPPGIIVCPPGQTCG